jgi:DNA-binding HxlR family transcriptional regulator
VTEDECVTDDVNCDAFASDCQVRLATDLLMHTWDPVVLVALRMGPNRRADLLRRIGGVTDKVLSEALRRLLTSGLIAPEPGGSPRRVSYGLTDLGWTLVEGPIAALGQWAIDHGNDVLDAQSRAAMVA